MLFNKPSTLLFLLVYFCFVNTSLAQSCFSESEMTNSYTVLLESEDNNEPSEYLIETHCNELPNKKSEFIARKTLENIPPQTLPCCNSDPPLSYG